MTKHEWVRPDVEATLGQLKDFQRRTVAHAFRRLYLDTDSSHRFLVADEVGLGKTLVAKGIIAKAIDHLWDSVDRIDVIYVCSNADIARQNVNRLDVMGRGSFSKATRLTMLPLELSGL
jgi:superfamily II DNA or RNA helicase